MMTQPMGIRLQRIGEPIKAEMKESHCFVFFYLCRNTWNGGGGGGGIMDYIHKFCSRTDFSELFTVWKH